MKGNKILYAGIAILVLGIGFAVGTYAYYQETMTGSATGTILHWDCTAAGETSAFTVTISNAYPGIEGSQNIVIASSINANYTITVTAMSGMGQGSTHPNLNLYSASGHAEANKLSVGESMSGSVTGGSTDTATIYYYWPYGESAETYNGTTATATLSIVCTQQAA